MNARIGSGWQTVLADLAMILFMITAAAVSEAPADPPRKPAPPPPPPSPAAPPQSPPSGGASGPPALGEPVAVWRRVLGGPTLSGWLAAQAADPRQRLTVIASPHDAGAALALADGASGGVRLLLDPAVRDAPYAVLAYDADPELARRLLRSPPPARATPAPAPGAAR